MSEFYSCNYLDLDVANASNFFSFPQAKIPNILQFQLLQNLDLLLFYVLYCKLNIFLTISSNFAALLYLMQKQSKVFPNAYRTTYEYVVRCLRGYCLWPRAAGHCLHEQFGGYEHALGNMPKVFSSLTQ